MTRRGFRFIRPPVRTAIRLAWRGSALALAVGIVALGSPPARAQVAPADTAAVAMPPQVRHVERLLRYFETIVFDVEFQGVAARRSISKWDGHVRISLHGRGAERFRWTTKHHIERLADITGLRMEVLGAAEGEGEIAIRFVAPGEMEHVPIEGIDQALQRQLARSRGCYFVWFKNPQNRIYHSEIVVNRQRDDRGITHCLLEELTQSLGLPNDSNMMRPSLFSDRDTLTVIPPTDRILLKTLYDPEMRPGFNRVRAMIVARRIISRLVEEGDDAAVAGTDDPLPHDFRQIPRKPAEPSPTPR